MFVLLEETGIRTTESYKRFAGKKSAVDKLPHEKWVRVMREAAKVDRQMELLRAGQMWLDGENHEDVTIKTGKHKPCTSR